MDLNAVHAGTLTALYFTPLLQSSQQTIELPPVVISGTKRSRFERRERALAIRKTPLPYLLLLDNGKTQSKTVRYTFSVPYASWMSNASLLLRQEIKDCCDLQLLGVDTLTRSLDVDRLSKTGGTNTKNKRTIQTTATAALQTAAPADTTLLQMVPVVPILVVEKTKRHVQNIILYIDYPIGKDEVYPDYKNNRSEIGKVDTILVPLLRQRNLRLQRIRVRGYASPDGDYRHNEQLAANRSRLFSGYIRDAYGLPERLFDVSSVAEDWTGLTELLNQFKPEYYREALQVINRYGIFSGREKQLMDLQGGRPYQDMLKNLFPKLRRIEVVVEYDDLRER